MIYRLPNRLVRVAQASCPPRDRFAVANLFCAKGALSSLAGAIAPGIPLHQQQALKARFNWRVVTHLGSRVNRAFSACGFLIAQILGRRPRLAMKQRLWRDTFPKRCEDVSHSKALRAKWARELCSVSRKLWECACVLASL